MAERNPGNRRFSVLILVTLFVAFLAPSPWYAARRTGAVEPGPPVAGAGSTFSVASINIARVTEVETMAREIEANSMLHSADVILLQEVVQSDSNTLSTGELLARRLSRQSAFASPDGADTHSGLSLLSRQSLSGITVRQLRNVNLVFRTRKRIALAATIETTRGPVRIINTHLDTRINPQERLDQLGPALADANGFDGPAIIGGDFNTNDMQWVSHVVPVPFPGWQASAVRKLMGEKGFFTPFEPRRATFDHMRMQLDWLFTNKMPCLRSAIQPLDFSDHHAIWAEFQLSEQKK